MGRRFRILYAGAAQHLKELESSLPMLDFVRRDLTQVLLGAGSRESGVHTYDANAIILELPGSSQKVQDRWQSGWQAAILTCPRRVLVFTPDVKGDTRIALHQALFRSMTRIKLAKAWELEFSPDDELTKANLHAFLSGMSRSRELLELHVEALVGWLRGQLGPADQILDEPDDSQVFLESALSGIKLGLQELPMADSSRDFDPQIADVQKCLKVAWIAWVLKSRHRVDAVTRSRWIRLSANSTVTPLNFPRTEAVCTLVAMGVLWNYQVSEHSRPGELPAVPSIGISDDDGVFEFNIGGTLHGNLIQSSVNGMTKWKFVDLRDDSSSFNYVLDRHRCQLRVAGGSTSLIAGPTRRKERQP